MKIDRPSFCPSMFRYIAVVFLSVAFAVRGGTASGNTSSNTTTISTKPLRTNTMATISDESFIRVSVSLFWQRSLVFHSVPPTLKTPIVNRNHRICVQRSWGVLFCFGRCVFRTCTSAYSEDKRSTKRDENASLSRRKPMVVLSSFLKYSEDKRSTKRDENTSLSRRKPMVVRVRYSKDQRFVLRLLCIFVCFAWALVLKYALVRLRQIHLLKTNEDPTTPFEQIRWLRFPISYLLECWVLIFDNAHQSFNRYHQP